MISENDLTVCNHKNIGILFNHFENGTTFCIECRSGQIGITVAQKQNSIFTADPKFIFIYLTDGIKTRIVVFIGNVDGGVYLTEKKRANIQK
jgi:hypothetical protein